MKTYKCDRIKRRYYDIEEEESTITNLDDFRVDLGGQDSSLIHVVSACQLEDGSDPVDIEIDLRDIRTLGFGVSDFIKGLIIEFTDGDSYLHRGTHWIHGWSFVFRSKELYRKLLNKCLAWMQKGPGTSLVCETRISEMREHFPVVMSDMNSEDEYREYVQKATKAVNEYFESIKSDRRLCEI